MLKLRDGRELLFVHVIHDPLIISMAFESAIHFLVEATKLHAYDQTGHTQENIAPHLIKEHFLPHTDNFTVNFLLTSIWI